MGNIRASLLFVLILAGFFTSVTPVGAAEEENKLHRIGNFFVQEVEDGVWASGMPSMFGMSPPKVEECEINKDNPNKMLLKFGAIAVPGFYDRTEAAIPAEAKIVGSLIDMNVEGWGTYAATPDLETYKDFSGIRAKLVSFMSGNAEDSVPADGDFRIVGLCIAEAELNLRTGEHAIGLSDILKGKPARLLYASIEYVDGADVDGNIDSVDALREAGTHTVSFIGFQIEAGEYGKIALEGRREDEGEIEFAGGGEAKVPVGNSDIEIGYMRGAGGENFTRFALPVGELNSIIDLGIGDDLVGLMMLTPMGKVFVAELPDGFSIPIPGLTERLRFGQTKLTFMLGTSGGGAKRALSMETVIKNPGVILGPLGKNISGDKKVGVSIEGKTIVLSFHNALEDIKPLGFELRDPVVSIDLDRKNLNLAGSVILPESLPLPLDSRVDITIDIGKDNLQMMLLSNVEIPIFDNKISIGLDTLLLGKVDKNLFFAAAGHARINEDLTLIPGLDSLSGEGLKLNKDAEVKAEIYVQTDGTFHIELSTTNLISLSAGPLNCSLKEIKFMLDKAPGGGWVFSLSGTTNLAIKAGILDFNLTTSVTVNSDGMIEVAIPEDPENPTRLALEGIGSIVIDYGKLVFNPHAQPPLTLDAVITLMLDEKIPMLGGQPFKGRIAMASDGSFLFEALEIPQIKWQGMSFGLSVLKVQNVVNNGQMVFSAKVGGQVEFLQDFKLEPLRGNRLALTAEVISNPAKVTLALEGPFAITPPSPKGGPGDFSFIFNKLEIAFGTHGVSAAATAGIKVKYPTSKYFLVGLPAALAGKADGPPFELGAKVTIGQNFVYFSTSDEYKPLEIPIDVPNVMEGITLQLNSLGGGVAYAGTPLPLFDVAARVYLPKIDGGGDFKTTTLQRPYHSYVGLVIAATMEKAFSAGFEISPDNPPSIKIGDVVEIDIREAALSVWLNATSIDLAGKVRFGYPERGLGFSLDMLPPEGKTDNGHLCLFPAGPMMIPVPFHRSLDIHTNLIGFETRLQTEFARPAIAPQDMIKYIPLMIEIFKNQDWDRLRTELQEGGQLGETIPRLKLKQAYMAFPKPLTKVFTALPMTKDGRRKLPVFNNIVIDPTPAVTGLVHMVECVTDPRKFPTKLVQFVPEDKRKGDFKVDFLGLLQGELHYLISAAGTKREREKVGNLKDLMEILAITEEIKPKISDEDLKALVVTLADKRKIQISGTSVVDLKSEVQKIIKEIDRKAIPLSIKSSPTGLLSHLWKTSNAKSSRHTVRGNRAIFSRSGGVTDEYNIRLDVRNPYGVPISGANVGPNAGFAGHAGVRGRGTYLPTTFPASFNKPWWHCRYRKGGRSYMSVFNMAGNYTQAGKGGMNLNLALRGSSQTYQWRWFWYRHLSTQAHLINERGQGVRNIAIPVMNANGWNAHNGKLRDFSLTMRPSSTSSINIARWGEATASMAGGQIMMRTMLKNSPASYARELCSLLERLDLGTLGDRDRSMARAWKRLWAGRDGGASNARGAINMKLKGGITVRMNAAGYQRVKHRYRTKVRYIRRWRTYWRKKRFWWGSIWLPYRRPEYAYKYVQHDAWINQMYVTGSGEIKARYSSRWNGYNSPRVLFAPARTNEQTGAPGIVHASRGWHYPGLVRNAKHNRYSMHIYGKRGWSASTDGHSLWIRTPEGKVTRLNCDMTLASRLRSIGVSGEEAASFTYGEPGTLIVNSDKGAGKAKSAEDVVALLGVDKLTMPRTVKWNRGSYKLRSNGTITDAYNLQALGGGLSSTTMKGAKTGRQYNIVVGDNSAQATYIKADGSKSTARIIRDTGQIEYVVSDNKRDGFMVDGKLAIGLEAAIRGETTFHGEIYSDGEFDLSGSAKLTVLSHPLASGKVRISSRDGFFIEGRINSPFIKASMYGTIQKRYFCLRGSVDTRIAGTGIVGNAVIDPSGLKANGKVYLLNMMLMNGNIDVGKNYIKVAFGARVGGRIIFWDYAVGYNCDVTLRMIGDLPQGSLRLCLWIDADWPVGYKSITFNISSPKSLSITKKVCGVNVTLDLLRFKITVKK